MVWKAHECPYLIVTPFLFITTKSWDCFQKVIGWAWSRSVQSQRRILEEGTFWKKVDETQAGHQILEEMAGLFPDG